MGEESVKEYQGVRYDDGRLTEAEFFAAYPDTVSVSLWGGRFIGSALTKDKYISFDHETGQYKEEKR
jgi:hypothetical protein